MPLRRDIREFLAEPLPGTERELRAYLDRASSYYETAGYALTSTKSDAKAIELTALRAKLDERIQGCRKVLHRTADARRPNRA